MSDPHVPQTPVPLIDLKAQYQTIRDEIREAVDTIFEDQSFVLGQPVTQLEEEVAAYCDARHAIGCASGTDALVLSLMALGIGPGDEVITSPFTFFATGGAIHRVGAIPVYVDIEPKSMNLDPALVEEAITPRTKAIMPVHIFGQCAEMEPLWRIAVRSGLALVEDAAQAIGSEYRGRRAGVLGTVGCFSFFPTKNLGGAGDGGMLTTDDADLAARLRSLRVHGQSATYQHREVGLNSRLDALQAAVLSVKLKHLDAWSDQRAENADRYVSLFEQHGLGEFIEAPEVLPERRHIYNQFTIRVKNGRRDELLAALRARQVGCNIYYPVPLHLQECFAYLGYKRGELPVSEAASENVMSLPIYPELTPQMQETVVKAMAEVFGSLSVSTSVQKAA